MTMKTGLNLSLSSPINRHKYVPRSEDQREELMILLSARRSEMDARDSVMMRMSCNNIDTVIEESVHLL